MSPVYIRHCRCYRQHRRMYWYIPVFIPATTPQSTITYDMHCWLQTVQPLPVWVEKDFQSTNLEVEEVS